MTDKELSDSLEALFAYDTGAKDSGIKDDTLKARCVTELINEEGDQQFGPRASRIARELFLTDDAIAEGYGLESVREFANWLEDLMQ